MKTNKEIIYDYIQQSYLIDNSDGVSTKSIADHFNLQRSNVSKLLNKMVKEGLLDKKAGRPVRYTLVKQDTDTNGFEIFHSLVGHEGSLNKAIQIAQAAVLYPNEKLNILVSSHSGAGRTLFVDKIFEYALKMGMISDQSELIKVNCKYYLKDSAALTEVIFGSSYDDSVFSEAKKGLLFIDNAEILSAKDTEKLNYVLKHKRLEDSDVDLSDTLIIIGVKTESKGLFSSSISMMIDLPDYSERPMTEKLDLVSQFFVREAKNSNRIIEVSSDVIKALMIHNFTSNVKELEIETKNLSAKAYVRTMDSHTETIIINENDLTINTRSGLINLKKYRTELTQLLGNSEVLYFDPNNDFSNEMNESNLKVEDLYETLNRQYKELSLRGFDSDSIKNVMDNHIKNLFWKYNYFTLPTDHFDLSNLNSIVDERILSLVHGFMELCEMALRRQFSPSVVYGLCLHINSLVENDFKKNRVSNNQILQVVQNYPEEYTLTIKFAEKIYQELNIELPLEEIVIITLFLIKSPDKIDEKRPVLLYIFHGIGVASSLMNVTKSLTKLDNCYSYDLDLAKKPEGAAEEIEQLIYDIDEGKGVIVIYDMGSIKTIIDTIIEKTTIKIRTFQFPVTLIGMEIMRKSITEDNIDTIYHQTTNDLFKLVDNSFDKVNLIITLCYTSEGGAVQLKQYIDQYSKLNYKTMALSISNKEELSIQVNELRKFYNIRAFVGTFDPKLFGIPYISLHEIFSTPKENLDKVLTFSPTMGKGFAYDSIYQNLEEQFVFTPMSKLKKILPMVVDKINENYNLDEDRTIGLFMHLASIIERTLSGYKKTDNSNTDHLIEQFPKDYDFILKNINLLEKEFNIIVNNHEIALIIMIVKML